MSCCLIAEQDPGVAVTVMAAKHHDSGCGLDWNCWSGYNTAADAGQQIKAKKREDHDPNDPLFTIKTFSPKSGICFISFIR